jgi:2'-5' RNA ligase
VTEITSDYASAWAQFQAAQTLRLQQETLEWEWTRGRTDFIAFLVPISDDDVRRYIASKIERIAGIPGVEAYPERYWHITVKQVGFLADSSARPDEVSMDQVRELADAARPVIESTPEFTTQAGLASAFPEVVILEAADGGSVRSLNKRLLGLPHLQTYPIDGDIFLPHISIARFTSDEGLPQLKETLTELRHDPPGPTFAVREVLLIQAHLAAEAPTFDLLAQYKLRSA